MLVLLLVLSLSGCVEVFATDVDLRIVNNTASDEYIELRFISDGELVETFDATVDARDHVEYSDALRPRSYTLTVNVAGERSNIVEEPIGRPDCTPPTLNIVVRNQSDVRYFYTCEDE